MFRMLGLFKVKNKFCDDKIKNRVAFKSNDYEDNNNSNINKRVVFKSNDYDDNNKNSNNNNKSGHSRN